MNSDHAKYVETTLLLPDHSKTITSKLDRNFVGPLQASNNGEVITVVHVTVFLRSVLPTSTFTQLTDCADLSKVYYECQLYLQLRGCVRSIECIDSMESKVHPRPKITHSSCEMDISNYTINREFICVFFLLLLAFLFAT